MDFIFRAEKTFDAVARQFRVVDNEDFSHGTFTPVTVKRARVCVALVPDFELVSGALK